MNIAAASMARQVVRSNAAHVARKDEFNGYVCGRYEPSCLSPAICLCRCLSVAVLVYVCVCGLSKTFDCYKGADKAKLRLASKFAS